MPCHQWPIIARALEAVSFTGFLCRLLLRHHVLIDCLTRPSVYTVAVQVSEGNQNFSLQVDTGSSDLVGVHTINRLPYAYCSFLSGSHQRLARLLLAPIPRGVNTILQSPVSRQVTTLTLRTSLVR